MAIGLSILVILGLVIYYILKKYADKFHIEIDETKPLYIVKNQFEITYYHMKSYYVCLPMTYPLEETFQRWRFEYTHLYLTKMVDLGLPKEQILSFDDWVLREHIGPNKYFKSLTPPKITHECRVFYSTEPAEYHKVDFLNTLVRERYPQYFTK